MLLNLQALRGIAALLVLMHHSLAHFRAMGLSNSVFEIVAANGSIGVSIFFVISGYVMAKTTSKSERGLNSSIYFIARRFARIYLGYWPVFFLALAIYYLHRPEYLADKQLLDSFLLLIFGDYYSLVITPAWSLTYELYFYLIIGLILLSNLLRPVPVFMVVSLLIILKNCLTESGNSALLDFFFSLFVYQFILGYLVFYYWRHIASKKWIFGSLVLGIASVLWNVQLEAGSPNLKFVALTGFSVCLVWVMLLLEEHKLIIFRGVIKKIGDSSYTLYLLHTLLLGLFYSLGFRDFLVAQDLALTGFIACIALIIFISWIFYVFVEAPLYNKVKLWLRQISIAHAPSLRDDKQDT